jgi:hypothetical protein
MRKIEEPIMNDEERFLRPDAIIEPLVDRFYAWLHTVAPVQAAMNLAFVQVPLLESYLQSPLVHINATRNPELRGGFFVGIDEDRSGEVRELLAAWSRSSTTPATSHRSGSSNPWHTTAALTPRTASPSSYPWKPASSVPSC